MKPTTPENEPTERELKLLQLAADGDKSKDMGDKLCLGEDAIEKERSSIINKMGAKSMPHAVAEGIRKGIIQ